MKRFVFLLVVALFCAFAPVANAQQGLNLGAVFQLDQKRIVPAVGVSFSMAAYTQCPPKQGIEDDGLAGLFTTSLGQYPILTQGTWAKICVFPSGIDNLEGVDFDPTGQARPNDGSKASSWKAMSQEYGGGYSIALQLNRLGAVPLRFRIRHRDGRDRFTLLIFTTTWTRGGDLPAALELMVQRRPKELDADASPEQLFPYMRGFLPATAQTQGQPQSQQINVPSQTATKTLGGDNTEGGLPVIGGTDRRQKSAPAGTELPSFGVTIQVGQADCQLNTGRDVRLISDFVDLPEPAGKSSSDTCTTIAFGRELSVAITLKSDRPFTGTIRFCDGREDSPLKVACKGNQYSADIFGLTENFVCGIKSIVVCQDHQTRTLTFARRK